MRRRILLVGASGVFGARLARLLADWDVTLVLAARRPDRLEALADALRRRGARAEIQTAAFDRTDPSRLAALAPWAVVDASGPFQAVDLRLPRAAVAAGAHYVDIADGRDFVAGFPAALDAEATAAGVLAVTGASSTPALSQAVLGGLTRGWPSVASVLVAISPGARAPRGLSVVQAILSYVGRPVRVFEGGGWRDRPGWSGLRAVAIPGLGRRWVSLCETPDLDAIPARQSPSRDALFLAGLELRALQLGLWLLSWPVRLGALRSLVPLARPLRWAAGLASRFGSDHGGMLVEVVGVGPGGERRLARWWLAAETGAGPTVPIAPAAAVLRALLDGRVTACGARACLDLVTADEIVRELAGLPIVTGHLDIPLDEPVLFRRVLGDRFTALPASVRRAHGAETALTLSGRGVARGGRAAWPIRALLGLPQPGRYCELMVRVAPGPNGERWTRRFGRAAFTSELRPAGAGEFEERFGPMRFRFDVETRAQGFLWRFLGWRLGPVPLPRALAPTIRARAFEADGGYRFRVVASHCWLGLLFAYAGRLG